MPSATAQCPAGAATPHVYRRRAPERTVSYRLVQEHLATWPALRDEDPDCQVSAHVERELRTYHECGILAHGFARAFYGACGHDFLIAFSCKGRGICPSCTAKRMSFTAAHLLSAVIPPVPVRQWVLSVPKRLPYSLARDGEFHNRRLRLPPVSPAPLLLVKACHVKPSVVKS